MKEKILRTAVKIISKQGLDAATTRNVCKAANVTAPTLYYYFKDKECLLSEVISFTFDTHFKSLFKPTKQLDPHKNIENIWDAYVSFAFFEPEMFAVMESSVAYGQVPDAGKRCFKALEREFEAASKLQTLKLSPKECATLLLAAAQGIVLMAKIQGIAEAKHSLISSMQKAMMQFLFDA